MGMGMRKETGRGWGTQVVMEAGTGMGMKTAGLGHPCRMLQEGV